MSLQETGIDCNPSDMTNEYTKCTGGYDEQSFGEHSCEISEGHKRSEGCHERTNEEPAFYSGAGYVGVRDSGSRACEVCRETALTMPVSII